MKDKENQFGHDISPEEAAKIIWEQWIIIRRLVEANNTQIEIPNTQKN